MLPSQSAKPQRSYRVKDYKNGTKNLAKNSKKRERKTLF